MSSSDVLELDLTSFAMSAVQTVTPYCEILYVSRFIVERAKRGSTDRDETAWESVARCPISDEKKTWERRGLEEGSGDDRRTRTLRSYIESRGYETLYRIYGSRCACDVIRNKYTSDSVVTKKPLDYLCDTVVARSYAVCL